MYKLLIITALYTGHGHKSISDALEERFRAYPDVNILTIDGFDLMDKPLQIFAERTYGPITRMPAKTWQINYALGTRYGKSVQMMVAAAIRARFHALIRDFQPDAVLSVHPIFLASIASLLEEIDSPIPLLAHEADLIDIASFWFDSRIRLLMCPSEESLKSSLEGGVDPQRAVQVGFPVRERFMGYRDRDMSLKDPVTVTIMSGSEGSGEIAKVARELLKSTNAKINVICGRNKALRNKIKKALVSQYYGRVNVMGFVENIQEIMIASDVLVMRASPNSVMEAVALNIPVVVFGQLAGQELHNPDMMQRHGLIAYCPDPAQLARRVNELTANGGAAMEDMRRAQRAYMPGDAAKDTVALIYRELQKIRSTA
ncbi:MAG: glycosyltransferase [Clostridiales bacterium]|nr:glycosyltransferase [Clostridiales bacterium]